MTIESGDDRATIQPDDRVDPDRRQRSKASPQFALETARKAGFKGLVTPSGAAALALARDFQPHAILLDISLPDIDGWRVLQRLKHDLSVRHIPVYVVSTVDQPEHGLKLGAQGMLPKPIQTTDVLEDFLTAFANLSTDRAARRRRRGRRRTPAAS